MVLVSHNRLLYKVLWQPGEGALGACGGGRAGISQDNSVFGVLQELRVAALPTAGLGA